MKLRSLATAAAVVLPLAGSIAPAAAGDLLPYVTVDASPASAQVKVGDHFQGKEFDNTRRLSQGAVGSLPVFKANDQWGCDWSTAMSSGIADWIGLAERGVATGSDTCGPFQQKFAVAMAAGADALIVINREPGLPSNTLAAAATIPGVIIDQAEGKRLRESLTSTPNDVKVTLGLLDSETFLPPIAADKTGKVEVGAPFAWDGTRKLGANPYYFKPLNALPNSIGPFSTYTCSYQPYQTCETVLLEFSNPLTQEEIAAGKTTKTKSANVFVDTFDPAQADFDFVAWASDAKGTKGEFFTGDASGSTSGNNPGQAESKTFTIQTTIDQPSVWMLLEVVYFAAPNASYKGRATF